MYLHITSSSAIFNKMMCKTVFSYNPNTVGRMSEACAYILRGVLSERGE